jgi:hypothetical protein
LATNIANSSTTLQEITPSASYFKQFFLSYPAYYAWKHNSALTDNVRDSMYREVNPLLSADIEQFMNNCDLLRKLLEIIRYNIVNWKVATVLELIKKK